MNNHESIVDLMEELKELSDLIKGSFYQKQSNYFDEETVFVLGEKDE